MLLLQTTGQSARCMQAALQTLCRLIIILSLVEACKDSKDKGAPHAQLDLSGIMYISWRILGKFRLPVGSATGSFSFESVWTFLCSLLKPVYKVSPWPCCTKIYSEIWPACMCYMLQCQVRGPKGHWATGHCILHLMTWIWVSCRPFYTYLAACKSVQMAII